MHISPAYTSRTVVHPRQQVIVGMDVTVPATMDVGQLSYSVAAQAMVIYINTNNINLTTYAK